ncbi:ATP-binding protein [Gracilinema caldarium]|uniref:ATP-binding protein n=1 Tax=Gracilinema caldarium TaxID=215591 RepID=UPI0026EDA525|nr:ATP-binding protein [Gracilinema caldarium]
MIDLLHYRRGRIFFTALFILTAVFETSAAQVDVIPLQDRWLFSFQDRNPMTVLVPSNWILYGKAIPALGYGRYERLLTLPPPEARPPLMLRIGEIGTACEVYIDDKLIGGQGTYSPDPAAHVPMVAPLYLEIPPNLPDQVKLTIKVSNYEDTNGGGIWGPIQLGSKDELLGRRDRALIRDAAMAGIFFIVFLFYLILYLYRRKNQALLLFALICLAFVFRQLVTGEKILLLLFPKLSWNLLVRIEYLSLYVLAPLYIRFFSVLFGPYRWPKPITLGLTAIGLGSNLAVLFLPVPWFIGTLIGIQIYWLLLFALTLAVLEGARRSGAEDAGLFLLSFSIFVLGGLNDLLLTRLFLPTVSLITLAQLLFILFQSLALARRFAREYRRTKNLEELNSHLQKLDEERSRFFAAASHELRTPVSLIITPIDGIQKGLYGEELRYDAPVFALIRRNCDRLKHLSEQLLNVLKIDTGMVKPLLQPVDMQVYLQKYMALFSAEAEKKKLRFELEAAEMPSVAHTDPVLLETVVLNLLSNGIKFTPPEGELRIRIMPPENGFITFIVQDSGPGIPAEQQAMLFTRHAAASRAQGPGVSSFGIGLPLSAEIVNLLGGTIRVVSEMGKGTSFLVSLPQSQKSQECQKAQSSREIAPDKQIQGETDRKFHQQTVILLVEDDEDTRNMLSNVLSSRFAVHSASSGAEALEKIQHGLEPDLIISDLIMYPMDGLTFRERLLAEPGFAAIPFLFISANQEPTIRERALGTGAVDFIQKPFYIDELVAKIGSLRLLMEQKQKRMEERILQALRKGDSLPRKDRGSWRERLANIKPTERDWEVVEYLLQGLSDKEIASQLGCSARTISNRVSSLLKRTGQPSRAALIAYLGGAE